MTENLHGNICIIEQWEGFSLKQRFFILKKKIDIVYYKNAFCKRRRDSAQFKPAEAVLQKCVS